MLLKVLNKVQPVTRLVPVTSSPRVAHAEARLSNTLAHSSDLMASSSASCVAGNSAPGLSGVVVPLSHVLSGEPTKPSTVVTTVSSTTELVPIRSVLTSH